MDTIVVNIISKGVLTTFLSIIREGILSAVTAIIKLNAVPMPTLL